MLLTDVMERAVNSAFEDREITLDSVSVHVSANVFTDAVIDGTVAIKFAFWLRRLRRS